MVSTSFHFKLFKILRVKWYRRDWGHCFGKTNVVIILLYLLNHIIWFKSLNLSFTFMANQHLYSCERFEPRSHFVSRLSMIVWVNVVLNRTVIVDRDWHFDNLCGSHLHSQSDLYQASWWYLTLVVDLIGQLSRDVIGRLSVKPCYRLCRLEISLVCFDLSIVTVKQWFIVSQIVSCPVVLS